MMGLIWAAITLLIWSAWPVFTRLALIEALMPADIVALRFGISGAVLLPVLLWQAHDVPARAWIEGILLAACQGAPFALLLASGLAYAPASHAAALTPGTTPLFAYLISVLFFREDGTPARLIGYALIVAGAIVLVAFVAAQEGHAISVGHLHFISAALIVSVYIVRVRRCGLTATQTAAIVCVYSAVIFVPPYLILTDWRRLAAIPPGDLLLHATYQGIVMGAFSLVTLNRAIMHLGASRATAVMSLLPVMTMLLGLSILGEVPEAIDVLAIAMISIGVALATGVLSFRRGSTTLSPG